LKTFIQLGLDDILKYFLVQHLGDRMPHNLLLRQIPHLQILAVHKQEAQSLFRIGVPKLTRETSAQR
jgi:hypothetical protein